MITNLRLKNFRGIKEGELELAPLTILLGGNNSAKSTILEALFLAPNPFRRVPYVVGQLNSATEVVHSMHETLSSEGYAFLLYNYTANQAEIGCKVDGKEYLLQFIRLQNLKDICVSTNKSVSPAGRIKTIDGQEVEVNRLGQIDMSHKGELYPDLKERLLDNTLLFSSKLVKMAYEYLEGHWASIINLGIQNVRIL